MLKVAGTVLAHAAGIDTEGLAEEAVDVAGVEDEDEEAIVPGELVVMEDDEGFDEDEDVSDEDETFVPVEVPAEELVVGGLDVLVLLVAPSLWSTVDKVVASDCVLVWLDVKAT